MPVCVGCGVWVFVGNASDEAKPLQDDDDEQSKQRVRRSGEGGRLGSNQFTKGLSYLLLVHLGI